MKTKLLKKVRKRYSITCIEKCAANADARLIDIYDHFKLPFYYVADSWNDWNNRGYLTFEESYSYLKKLIYNSYRKTKTRNSKAIETKVWWNNNLK